MNEASDSTVRPISNLGSVILCGGKSSRFGMDKAQLMLQGSTFLQRIIQQASTVTRPVVAAIGNDPRGMDQLSNVVVVRDEIPQAGPLEGMRAGLMKLSADVEFGFICGCDTPLLRSSLIESLFDLIGDHQAVVPFSGKRIFGATAVYRTDIAKQLAVLIDQQRLRVMDLGDYLDIRYVDTETLKGCDPELDSFVNINTRDDYFQLLRRFDEEIPETLR